MGCIPGARCAPAARALGEPLTGTAPYAAGWLLLEYPRPWPARPFDPPDEGKADPDRTLLALIGARAAELAVRPLLIRRPGRVPCGRRFAVIDAATESAVWGTYEEVGEVLSHLEGHNGPGEPMAEQLFLVCTHGQRDQCCAIAGRPVAAAFAQQRASSTWECSHLGGHRFAANVAVLPHGLLYGYVDPPDVPAIISATDAGRAHLPLLRGRTTDVH